MNIVEALVPSDAATTADLLEDVTVGVINKGNPQKQRLIINDPRLKYQQRIHAIAVSGLGLLGLTLAIYMHLHGHPVSVTSLVLFSLFFLLAGSGITVGYHRCFTHRGFRAPAAVKVILAILGSMSGQGPVVYWAAVHRMHHMLSDEKGDPHSPNLHGDGFWNRLCGAAHAFIGWTVAHNIPNTNVFSRDLLSDKIVMWVSRRYYWWLVIGWALPAVLGAVLTATAYGAFEGLLWGGWIRMLAGNSGLYAVAFFGHASAFGSRHYATNDFSRNGTWLAIPSLGESWHNNHHAFPRSAIFGLRWWQLDIGGIIVTLLEKLGLISEVCRPTPDEIRQRRQT